MFVSVYQDVTCLCSVEAKRLTCPPIHRFTPRPLVAMCHDKDRAIEINDKMVRIHWGHDDLDMGVPFGVGCYCFGDCDGCFCSVTVISPSFLESLNLIMVTVDD